MRELKGVGVTRRPAAFGELIHFRGPFVAQIKLGRAEVPQMARRRSGGR